MVNKEEIGDWLLQKGYLLTALEFYQELLEDDGTDLDVLREYFIKQTPNFEAESRFRDRRRANSLTDRESNLSEVPDKIREKDDRISLLEYELRRAREDISNLRIQLTTILKKPPTTTSIERAATPALHSIKDHELRTLNFLVKNYLVNNKLSLTAITLSEEVADEMNSWKDMGLEIEEPPPLLSLYRFFFENEESGIQGALSKSVTDIVKLKKELSEKEHECRNAKLKVHQYQKENEKLQHEAKELELVLNEARKESESTPLQTFKYTKSSNNATSVVIPESKISSPPDEPVVSMRQLFKSLVRKKNGLMKSKNTSEAGTLEAETSVRIAQEVEKVTVLEADNQGVVKLVADCLPHIVPGVILNKREELIPVILCVISQHPESSVRLALTKLLFNLIKKPNELQRQVIVRGCVSLAYLIGPQRAETELFTQIWDQIAEKYAERRALVVDSCGALAVSAQPEIRQSLLLSILQQMSEDCSSLVRGAVARNLAVLICCFENGDKYSQVEQLFLRLLLREPEPEVVNITYTQLLSALADWSNLNDMFLDKLVPTFFVEIQSILMKVDGVDTTVSDSDTQQLYLLVTSLVLLMPHLHEYILGSAPSLSVKELRTIETHTVASFTTKQNGNCILDDKSLACLQQVFDQFVSSQPEGVVTGWPALEWVISKFLPNLTQIVVTVPSSAVIVTRALVELVHTLCAKFGTAFTKKVVKCAFLSAMYKHGGTKRARILPIYLSGVLTVLDEAELIKFLHELIVNIAVQEAGWDHSHMLALKDVIAQFSSDQSITKHNTLIDTLCDMVVHPASQVRTCIVALFNVVVPAAKVNDIAQKILPALLSLGMDPDRVVRTACVEPLGAIAVNGPEGPLLDQLADAFDKILADETPLTKLAVIRTLADIIPSLSLKPRFRDFYILPRLVEQARKNNFSPDAQIRQELAQALFDAFRILVGIPLSKDVIDEQILPGLRSLLQDAHLMDASYKSIIQSMIYDMELSLSGEKDDDKSHRRTASSILGKLDFSANTPAFSSISIPKWTWKKP